MNIVKFEDLENKLIEYKNKIVLIDTDVAELYGVATKEINQAVSNNLKKLKYSPHLPKIFTEKGLYMLVTIIKSKVATDTTIKIIEAFAKATAGFIGSHLAIKLLERGDDVIQRVL